jgi:D-sedoheptulose 7-phosphate isomerase
MLLIFSIGGGHSQRQVSANLVAALQCALQVGARLGGIVGRAEGYTAQVGGACAETFQAVIWHALVSHPALKMAATKW